MYILSEVKKDDGEIFASWLEQESINKWLGGIENWYEYFEYVDSNPEYFLFKASLDDKIIGAIAVEIIDGIGCLGTFMVNPDEHNKGHGKKILNLFLQDINKFIKKNFKYIETWIEPNNIASKRCFESCGFKFVEIDDENMMNYIYNID